MPGIYTHNVIFKKALESLSRKSSSSYLCKSVVSLFSSPEHLKAGLFGSIGPNIFDYMNLRYKWKGYGSEIAFYLHDEASDLFISKMIRIIEGYKDSRNEWASVQRAYIMGYISHIIADAVIHPFVFYYSGFPSGTSRKDIIHYRRLNLIFQYNIDNYYLYKDEGMNKPEIDEMIPYRRIRGSSALDTSLKVLILQSLKEVNEGLFKRSFRSVSDREINGSIGYVRGLDSIPGNIKLCYRLKRTENERLKRIADRINEIPLLYSDFLVRYPGYKRVDMDALNFHQGRWQYPAGQKGLRYESLLHLVKTAVDRISDAWVQLESTVYGSRNIDLSHYIEANPYTGEKGESYNSMKIKEVIKLKL